MAIRIVSRQRQLKIDRPSVLHLAELILVDHGESGSDVSIVFARDSLLADLNASFRDVDRATDVLAFPMAPERESGRGRADYERAEAAGGPGPERVLGDVVISVDRAIAQAGRYGKTPEDELLKLVSHGVLHLLGHDHDSPGDRRRMRNLENRYLRLHSRAER
jgi:probable rRNA maturation factor